MEGQKLTFSSVYSSRAFTHASSVNPLAITLSLTFLTLNSSASSSSASSGLQAPDSASPFTIL